MTTQSEQRARPALRKLTEPPPLAVRRRDSPWRLVARVLGYLALVAFAISLLTPFFWMVMSSLKSSNDVFSLPITWIPSTFVWKNYVDIWSGSGMGTWMKNTVILAVAVTILQLLTGSFAAYGFSKIRFRGRNLLFLLYLATIAIPWQSYMIPQFVMLSSWKVSNTLWAIILIQAFGAFGVFLMKQFYETIPEDLSEAARLDGLTEYGIWWRVILPLSRPALASLGLLTFVTTWNDYVGPLLYLRNPDLWTIQLGLNTFIHTLYNANYALLFAGLTVSVLPILIIFLIGQRYFIEGIATSGLKG